ncbi:MAG: serine hydrolase domain-containing protein [Woeseiaceae bacterium]
MISTLHTRLRRAFLRRQAVIWVLALTFALPARAESQSADPPVDLDAWVERTMQTFEVPGIAVAIVKDGRAVVTKGYGVRRLGQRQRVDEHTLFGIASNTKAFTATALGLLVEEGKLEWDGG